MRIYCYGDSNTYGYDPRAYTGGRYPAQHRWVDIIAAQTGHEITNAGENGRVIPRRGAEYPDIPPDTDIFAVMLGTNDILQGGMPTDAAARMEAFLTALGIEREKILLIAPPPMGPGEWVTDELIPSRSALLAVEYSALAERLGVKFADAGKWGVGLAFDGVHFSEAGHAAFAEGLKSALKTLYKNSF